MSDQAIDWILLLHSGKAIERDKVEAEQWRRRSPEHERAYAEAEALWRYMGNVLAANTSDSVDSRAEPAGAKEFPLTIRRSWAAGLAAAVVLLLLLTPFSRYRDRWLSDYYTDIGAQQTVTLADGSSVLLNTDSAISVHYDQTGRRIELHRGQALFSVAADRKRPFDVTTADARVRALGTVFEVREDDGGTRVTVLEHAVSLKSAGHGLKGLDEIRIVEGRQAGYRRATGLSEPVPVDTGQISAWQRGKLIFKNRPLAEVTAELERYLPGRIVIADQTIASLKVSGVFPLDEPELVLNLIGKTLPVEIAHLSRWLTVLYKA